MADNIFGFEFPQQLQSGALAPPSVEDIQMQMRRELQAGSMLPSRPASPSLAESSGMRSGGIATAIRNMKARRVIASAAKEGIDTSSAEGADELGKRLNERGLVEQAQAQFTRAAAIREAQKRESGERFGNLEVLGQAGDKVLVGQRNEQTNKLVNFQVIDKETYDNMRASMKDREGKTPSIPAEPTKLGLESVKNILETEKKKLAKEVGFDPTDLSDDELMSFTTAVEARAQELQSQVKQAGGTLDVDTARRAAIADVGKKVSVEGKASILGIEIPFTGGPTFQPGTGMTEDDPLGLR